MVGGGGGGGGGGWGGGSWEFTSMNHLIWEQTIMAPIGGKYYRQTSK